ncbi:MAG: universal stress protein [Myxococcota bacterium]|nr:universal stress protein [Myxococcota bacterium]
MQQARRQVAALLSDLGLGDATVRLKEGEPAAAQIEAADELRPDLVVIGTRGRGGLARLLLGSVAQALLARLEHDTLVVPPPAS